MAESENGQDTLQETGRMDRLTKRGISAKIYVVVIFLLLAGCTGLYIYGHNKLNTLNGEYTSLHTSTDSLKSENKKLTAMNANLQKSYTALKNVQSSSKTGNSNTESSISGGTSPSVAQATSSFTIDKVQEEPESQFGVTDQYSNTELLVATVTIKNLSSASQTYSAYDFSAITNSGAVKRTPGWADGPPVNANFWIQSTIAPEGTDTEQIAWLYSDYSSLGFTTIEFSPPGSAPTQSLPLPALSD